MNDVKILCLAGLLFLMFSTAQAEENGPSGSPAGWPEPVSDSQLHSFVLIDQLEYRATDGPDAVGWDALGWFGGDYNRLWIETEGEHRTDGDGGEIERLDVQYGRLIAPFWDLQAGMGYQRIYGPGPDHDRFSGVIGVQGLAPYMFEVDANLRVSEDGDVSVDFEAEYDLLLTQRLILQPRFETAFAFQEVEAFGLGQGFTSVGLDLRLGYEIRREFAPYIGVSWTRKLGETADIARAAGEDIDVTSFVAGIKLWF